MYICSWNYENFLFLHFHFWSFCFLNIHSFKHIYFKAFSECSINFSGSAVTFPVGWVVPLSGLYFLPWLLILAGKLFVMGQLSRGLCGLVETVGGGAFVVQVVQKRENACSALRLSLPNLQGGHTFEQVLHCISIWWLVSCYWLHLYSSIYRFHTGTEVPGPTHACGLSHCLVVLSFETSPRACHLLRSTAGLQSFCILMAVVSWHLEIFPPWF